MNNDSIVLSELFIKDLSENGLDNKIKQERIMEKANKAREILEILYSGQDIYDNNNDEKYITEEILNLLHFKQYAFMTMSVFNEWHSPIFLIDNNRFSDNMYLQIANECKKLNELANGELFEITICDLLMRKAKYDETKIQQIYDICWKIIGKEWLECGLLKSLKTEPI